MEVLERRLLLTCTTDFSSAMLSISCDAETLDVVVSRDAAGAITLNAHEIVDHPMASLFWAQMAIINGRLIFPKVPLNQDIPVKYQAPRKLKLRFRVGQVMTSCLS